MFKLKKKNNELDNKLNSRVGKVFTSKNINSNSKQEEVLLLSKCS